MNRSKTLSESTIGSNNDTIQRSEFTQQLDCDDDNDNFTAADERFAPLVILSAAFNEEAPRPGKRPLERGEFAEKMARQTNPGTLLLVFNFYAKLFAPHQQMQAKVPTYSEIMFANNTLSMGEMMCFCADFRIVPHLLTRNDIRNIWPFIGEELDADTKRVGKELSLDGFQELLVRVALLNGLTPEGRQKKLCDDKQPHSAIAALVKWLHLDDRSAIKHKLDTIGVKTKARLSSTSHEQVLGNPYTVHDKRRFTLLDSLHPKKITISEMLEEANRKLKATKKRGRRGGNVNITQGLAVLNKIMGLYHHSLKHSFVSFESELVTTSWKRFNRDRPSGQICRAYVDCGDCIEGIEYNFTLRIKNQTMNELCVIGVDYRSRVREAAALGATADALGRTLEDVASEIEQHPVQVTIDRTDEKHKNLVLHPGATRRVDIIVRATKPCEVFEMLQFQAVQTSSGGGSGSGGGGGGRRGTTFFQKVPSKSATGAAAADALDPTRSIFNGRDFLGTRTSGNEEILQKFAQSAKSGSPADARPGSRPSSRPGSRPGTGGSSRSSPSTTNKKRMRMLAQQQKFVVHCPFYLRCPTPRDFYIKPLRIQQTLHQRMSLPHAAFDDVGNMEETYDGFDDDVGPFNSRINEEPDFIPASRNSPSSRSSGSRPSSGQSTDSGRVSSSGFLGDSAEAKAARQKAREMREKLSKTEYMKELEQKTKDCWDGNYQFQEDRSAQYRESPKHARRMAKRVMHNATRGGKDVCLAIPVIDVRLRYLADPPKLEWSRRRGSTTMMSATGDSAAGEGGTEGREGEAAAGARGSSMLHSASTPNMTLHNRPPPPMIAVTKFNQTCYDMRNPKHLFNMLHGNVNGNGTATKKERLPNL